MWIELSEFNIKIFLPLIFPIFNRINDLTREIYKKKDGDNKLFKNFRYFLCKNTKKKKEDNKIKEEGNNDDGSLGTIEETRKRIQKDTKLKSILFLLGLSIIGFLSYFFGFIKTSKKYKYTQQSLGIFFVMFEFIILCKLILKQKFYKHNWISAGIIVLILIILFIITTNYLSKDDIIPDVFYDFILLCGFGLYDTLGKYYMNKFFNSPYYLMFVIGIFASTVLLIFDLFRYWLLDFKGIIDGFRDNITDISKFFLFLLDIIIEWIWNCGIWLTIYYFTPCHYFISEYIEKYIYYLIKTKDNNDPNFYSTINITIFSFAFCINN